METNPARNSQLETHQDDEPGSRLRAASVSLMHRIERSPHALERPETTIRRRGSGKRGVTETVLRETAGGFRGPGVLRFFRAARCNTPV